MPLKDKIKDLSAQYFNETVELRRHLHQHPELSFQEEKTAAFISAKLKSWGIEHQTGIAKTGIVALIKGKNPHQKTIALRADMDALPIEEKNEVPYKSLNSGVMHACGHDVHSASLLGTAKILNELKGEFEGTIKLIFQPSEEKLPGGASVMISEGALENPSPSAIFGQHVFPELESGKVGFRPGKYMASADEIYLTIKGKGGHAAMPHLNIDPVIIAAHTITALQQLVSRNAKPAVPSVLSFGKITGKGATNVIPDEVKLEGTFRTLDEEWRAEAHQKITNICQKTAEAIGGKCEVDIRKGYPYLENNSELTLAAKNWAEDYLGKGNVVDMDIRMTAEDFAFYSQKMPACFYRLGTRNEQKDITSSVHTATFDIDEKALETGMGLMAWLAVNNLKVN